MPHTFVKCEKRLRAVSKMRMYVYDCCSDCDVVFRNASKDLDRCPKCNKSRYDDKFQPVRRAHYLSICEFLEATMANADYAK